MQKKQAVLLIIQVVLVPNALKDTMYPVEIVLNAKRVINVPTV